MSLSNKKSAVWEFFDLQTNDITKAKCILCGCLLSRGGVGKKATTTSLLNHIRSKHPQNYSEISKENNLSTESGPSGVVSQGIKRKQETLKEVLEKRKLWDINDHKAIKLHNIIGEMIACDNQPYSFVEDVGFLKLMKEAQPRYKVPTRKYFQYSVLPSMYKECKTKISSLLETAEAVSLTSDIWTSSVNNHSFISLTGHWINNDFNAYHAAIGTKPFPGSHTAEAVSEVIKATCSEWNLSNKIHLVLRDGGTNMVKGFRIAEMKSEYCFLHLLHLVVTNALTSQRTVNDLIALSKRIVTHFNHSSLACSRMREIQRKLGNQEKKLIQDVSTRWNSTYYMLERLQEQKNEVSLYAAEYGDITNLTANQWMILQKTLNLLKPFETITKEVSSAKSIISVVLPMVATLKLYLSKPSDHFSGVGTLKDTLLQNLEKRFSSIENNEHYIISTALDPRFKLAFFSKAEAQTSEQEGGVKIKNQLIALIEAVDTKLNEQIGMTVVSNNAEQVRCPSTFWDCFSEITDTSVIDKGMQLNSAALEVNNFLQKPLLGRLECPMKWWKENSKEFPKLARLAQKYLSAPSSTVYSERLFSEAGNIYEKHRSRILPENAELLLFLHHNYRLFNNVNV